jgi:hypothetical protein
MSFGSCTETLVARIHKIGILLCVDVPREVSQALGNERRIAVRGTAEGIPFVSTLLPRAKGRHKLYVHSKIWRKLRRDAGDEVEIALERDFESREVAAPADLIATLRQTAGALEAYRTRTPALQREVITWISAAKRPGTREKRL